MASEGPPSDTPEASKRLPYATSNTPSSFKPSPAPPNWSSQSPVLRNGAATPSSTYPAFSASTNEILERLRANAGNAAGTPAFEAKKAEVLQNYVTSDKLPTPPPVANSGRRGGRGGGRATPSALKTEVEANLGSGATPTSARGSGKGRGRGRGGGRGGKRKRAESVDSDDDSDISSSYTPRPTRTKSGRNVNKPVAFVPTLPEPSPAIKRRKSVKTILAAQCKICHRSTEMGNNRIVFCDICSTAYHQYCHAPPIENEVVNVLEKEWLCGPCERSKQSVIEGTEGLIAGEGLTIDEKRAYLSTLPQARLVTLLLHATVRHPELPLFPPKIQDLIPDIPPTTSQPATFPVPSKQIPIPHAQPLPPPPTTTTSAQVTSPANGTTSTSHTPRSHNITTNSSDVDPAEAQLLGEIRHSQHPGQPPHPSQKAPPPSLQPIVPMEPQIDEYDDGYDTDPPAHYPKAGNGIGRTLRPESEDLQWLVDDNFEVFSHGWKGDGSGLGADGTLHGIDAGEMDVIVHGRV